MNRRTAMLALPALAVSGLSLDALGQQKQTAWRVGFFLSRAPDTLQTSEKIFLAGMKDYGYELGRNLILDVRYADDAARYASVADELLALRPDVIVVSSTGNALVLKNKTNTIPIVLGSVADPVGAGLVQSLARPGGNVTGNSLQLVDLGAKQIELIAEALPGLRRVAILTHLGQLKATRERYEQVAVGAATSKGLVPDVHRVDGAEKVRQAFRDLEAKRADALLINPSPPLNALRPEICQSAARIRLPAVGFSEEWARDGALMAFGPSWVAAYRRAAYFVDRILKGAKPAGLPIEQPTKFDLVVNARAARALGLKIPQSILLRADRVIE